jgi:hypothetical protein
VCHGHASDYLDLKAKGDGRRSAMEKARLTTTGYNFDQAAVISCGVFFCWISKRGFR